MHFPGIKLAVDNKVQKASLISATKRRKNVEKKPYTICCTFVYVVVLEFGKPLN